MLSIARASLQGAQGWDLRRALLALQDQPDAPPASTLAAQAVLSRLDKASGLLSSLYREMVHIAGTVHRSAANVFEPLFAATRSQIGYNYFRVHPKGRGLVCTRPGGLPALTFVEEYLGDIHAPWRWFEIQVCGGGMEQNSGWNDGRSLG